MRALTLALALLLPALVACSSSEADESAEPTKQEQTIAAWEADVAKTLGTDEFDLPALEQQAAADCARTDVEQWTAGLVLSGARSEADLTRIGLTHACPEVVDVYDSAVEVVDSTADPLTLVCAPGVELGDDDARLAEMACANR